MSIDGTLIYQLTYPLCQINEQNHDGNIIIVGENGIIKINNSLEVLWVDLYPELSLKSISPLSNEGLLFTVTWMLEMV